MSSTVNINTIEQNIAAPLSVVANSGLANGSIYRITLNGLIGGPQYSISVRFGANGNSLDPAIFSTNNILSNTFLLSDLSNFFNIHPGSPPTVYRQPTANSYTPAQCVGQLLVYVANVSTNAVSANISIVSGTQNESNNWFTTLPTGVLCNVGVNGSVVTNYLTVTSNVYSPWQYQFVGINQGTAGTPYNSFNLVPGPLATNSVFSLGVVEQIYPAFSATGLGATGASGATGVVAATVNVMNLTMANAISQYDVIPAYSNTNQIFQQYSFAQLSNYIESNIPVANNTTQGIVKLVDNYITSDASNAATANALHAVYVLANTAFAANGNVVSIVGTTGQIVATQALGTVTLAFPANLTITNGYSALYSTINVNMVSQNTTTLLVPNILINAGSSTNAGGTIYLNAGNTGTNANGVGGSLIFVAGSGLGQTGQGGSVYIYGGSGSGVATGTSGGAVNIYGGSCANGQATGGINLFTRISTNAVSGSIGLTTGGSLYGNTGGISISTGTVALGNVAQTSTGGITFSCGSGLNNLLFGATIELIGQGQNGANLGGSIILTPGTGGTQAQDGTTQILTAEDTPAMNVDVNATVTFCAATSHQGYAIITPGTGYNSPIANFIDTLIIIPNGTIATCNLTLPSTPIDGQVQYISTTNTISTFNVAPSAGYTLSGLAPTTFTNTVGIAYIFIKPRSMWIRKY